MSRPTSQTRTTLPQRGPRNAGRVGRGSCVAVWASQLGHGVRSSPRPHPSSTPSLHGFSLVDARWFAPTACRPGEVHSIARSGDWNPPPASALRSTVGPRLRLAAGAEEARPVHEVLPPNRRPAPRARHTLLAVCRERPVEVAELRHIPTFRIRPRLCAASREVESDPRLAAGPYIGFARYPRP